jgi:ABC-type lipoprotein release transport system permease subunit
LVLGLAAAMAATRLLATMLFQVQPIDLQVYVAVVVLVGLVTVVAGYLPAWRAAVVNPVEVLKTD